MGRRQQPLDELADRVRQQGGQAQVVTADLTERGAPVTVVASARAAFGGIDVLVNDVGDLRAGRLEAIEESEVMAQVALNRTALIRLTPRGAAQPAGVRARTGHQRRLGDRADRDAVLLDLQRPRPVSRTSGEALRRELYGEGVHVLTVYPGGSPAAEETNSLPSGS